MLKKINHCYVQQKEDQLFITEKNNEWNQKLSGRVVWWASSIKMRRWFQNPQNMVKPQSHFKVHFQWSVITSLSKPFIEMWYQPFPQLCCLKQISLQCTSKVWALKSYYFHDLYRFPATQPQFACLFLFLPRSWPALALQSCSSQVCRGIWNLPILSKAFLLQTSIE